MTETGARGAAGEPLSILMVEDRPEDAELVIAELRRAGFDVSATRVDNEEDYLAALDGGHDLILSDHSMPRFDSARALQLLVKSGSHVPFIIVSGTIGEELAVECMKRGASDYLLKDHLARLGSAVTNVLAERRDKRDAQAALDRAWRHSITRLAHAVEYRDPETGGHIERMSRYCAELARALGFDADRCELLQLASPMHDVGKVAIRDEILLKPGPLDHDEREHIERHAEIGHSLLSGSDSELLETAATIALTHHERWDGTGYPHHLRARDIPLDGRIAAVADVFDALTTNRPYRVAMAVDAATQLMAEQRGRHFDPDILDALLEELDTIQAIGREHAQTRLDLIAPAA
jgi:putative two-component system response regulator